MEFTVNGNVYSLIHEEVEERMRDVEPEPGRRHFAVVNGRRYPVKQILAVVLNVDKLDFSTQQARSVLQRLGFKVSQR